MPLVSMHWAGGSVVLVLVLTWGSGYSQSSKELEKEYAKGIRNPKVGCQCPCVLCLPRVQFLTITLRSSPCTTTQP